MGELEFFLGLQIQKTSEGIMIHQLKYIKELIRKFGMENSHTLATPMVTDKKLTKDEDGYSDADYAGCSVDRKSTSGITMFVRPCIISWGSKKQNSVDVFTAEAEYIAAALHSCTKHIDIGHDFLREQVEKKNIKLKFCSTGKQWTDILTKALAREYFETLRWADKEDYQDLGEYVEGVCDGVRG
ncbi:secreted RxLR effector protein 161-like [Silene latifolia]|uniref:secreted RxLR effector protein 161-like n=1 Tax=Silene latifolia TaxID=37657 RepID=UPI003D774BAE